jgi:hypothetical protein
MPEAAQMEVVNIEGREIRVRWRLARHGEWLAWCYVAAANQLHNEGAGFEERAGTPEEARAAVIEKARSHIKTQSSG